MKESGEYGPQSGRRRKGKMAMGGCRREVGEEDVTVKFLSRSEIPSRRGSEGWVVEGINFVITGNGSSGVCERRYFVIEVNFCPRCVSERTLVMNLPPLLQRGDDLPYSDTYLSSPARNFRVTAWLGCWSTR